ncbi:MFS transporter [Martelella soudanensis]|uniref:MFS transporter n=1 Tax=unclassified Martelella TaxID=2629616 RepID=UPI001AEE24DC|nr:MULTISPECIES: MFS transporter [unclassified Martelella]
MEGNMMDAINNDPGTVAESHSVQHYIDEHPYWADGTAAPAPQMTMMQWRIWCLSVAGKFFEGLVVFMTGVAMPLIAREFGLNAAQHGLVGSASLFGILIGASALGSLSDRFGRKRVFIFEIGLFIVFLGLIVFTPNFPWLIVCLFGMGLALGCDYPTAHLVISESTPSRTRGGLVLSAFGFQAVGALFGTILGYIILTLDPSVGAWRWMYGCAIIPALAVFAGRFFIPESPHWLAVRGRERAAETELQKLLHRQPRYPKKISINDRQNKNDAKQHAIGYRGLFQKQNRRALILASVPWFLQDLGTYGIGIFTPTILAATVGHERAHAQNIADLVHNDLIAAKGAALLDVLLLVGIVAAVLLADRLGRIRLQVFGFIGCAAGLFIAAQAGSYSGMTQTTLIFTGFMLFNFMTNLGPNAQTYLIAGEVFPTRIRGTGAGFAASFAKIGACLTAFLFPVLLADIGTTALLYALVATSLAGAVVTFFYRIETNGISLDAS